jgi:hypothetical protein
MLNEKWIVCFESMTVVSSPGACVAAVDTGETFLPTLLLGSRGKPRLNQSVPQGFSHTWCEWGHISYDLLTMVESMTGAIERREVEETRQQLPFTSCGFPTLPIYR